MFVKDNKECVCTCLPNVSRKKCPAFSTIHVCFTIHASLVLSQSPMLTLLLIPLVVLMIILVMDFAHGINKICKLPTMSSVIMSLRDICISHTNHCISLNPNKTIKEDEQQIRRSETLLRRAAVDQLGQLTETRCRKPSGNKQQPSTPAHFNGRGVWSLGGAAGSHTVCTYCSVYVSECGCMCGTRVHGIAYTRYSSSWHRLDITSDNKCGEKK